MVTIFGSVLSNSQFDLFAIGTMSKKGCETPPSLFKSPNITVA
jgi:hypothetical protein